MDQMNENIIEAKPTSDSLDTLGGRILKAREEASYSVNQLAHRVGVRSSTLHSWESDKSEPRSNKLVMLAGVLGVSPSWLLTGVGQSPGITAADGELSASELRKELADLKERVSDLDQCIQNIMAKI